MLTGEWTVKREGEGMRGEAKLVRVRLVPLQSPASPMVPKSMGDNNMIQLSYPEHANSARMLRMWCPHVLEHLSHKAPCFLLRFFPAMTACHYILVSLKYKRKNKEVVFFFSFHGFQSTV